MKSGTIFINRKTILSLIVFIFFINFYAYSGGKFKITLRPNRDWDLTIDQSDLSGGGGSDTVSIESASDQKNLSISKSSGTWQVGFFFSDISQWNSGFTLQVRRTGSGTGGSVSGGTNYMTITTTSQVLFSGTGDTQDIPFQYRIGSGIAGSGIHTGDYSIEITVTVTDGY